MNDNEPKSGSVAPAAAAFARTRAALDLLRQIGLMALVAAALIWPEWVGNTARSMGITHIGPDGVNLGDKVAQQDRDIVTAQATITELHEQTDILAKVLAEAKSQLADPALKARITSVEAAAAAAAPAAQQVQATLQTAISGNAALVEQIDSGKGVKTQWGVVFAGDTEIDKARYEVDTAAPKLGVSGAVVYHRQGMFRSVALSDDRNQINQLLATLRQRRADAYIVNMGSRCPRWRQTDRYRDCDPA